VEYLCALIIVFDCLYFSDCQSVRSLPVQGPADQQNKLDSGIEGLQLKQEWV